KKLLHRGMRSLQLLDEEQAAYKRKLQAYQEGQQRQAQLVQKLQAKVLQYKKKCGEVEQQLLKKETELDQPEEDSPNELENALIRLEEEQQRSCSLVQVNSMLREQLEQANVANAALSEDIRKLTADWARARGELEQREAQWRREEEVRAMGRCKAEGCCFGGTEVQGCKARGLQDHWDFAWREIWGCTGLCTKRPSRGVPGCSKVKGCKVQDHWDVAWRRTGGCVGC
uniref:Rootletin-like coiled-coil domain-containing protein n=1 Tax=Phasianus colchicus TaxID=9054 RepID=A0A669QPI1_PHACC